MAGFGVIVVGLGGMGSAAAAHLAARLVGVLPTLPGRFLSGVTCMCTTTPDQHFVIARPEPPRPDPLTRPRASWSRSATATPDRARTTDEAFHRRPGAAIVPDMDEDDGSAVRRATAADRALVARVLAAAFADDPVFTYLFPPGTSRREARLQRMFALETARSEQRSGTWVADGGAGATVWFPPGRWRSTTWEDLRDAAGWIRLFGGQLRLGQQARSVMEAHHRPLPDHWYLLYMGVEQARRGQGIGGALLRPVLDECDRTGTPAYLEASGERNRALYARHGFVARDALQLPDGGPTVFPMWREPA